MVCGTIGESKDHSCNEIFDYLDEFCMKPFSTRQCQRQTLSIQLMYKQLKIILCNLLVSKIVVILP